ncbi:hypothetical protein Hypma_006666 [Hypsizygus marmoreus]|uniref:DUF6535 domain-containing protein n=1 Tax=Hypsizygus marmoreus TaxID=39966 RepID=A0A369JTV1_HYPMA|nr:hypothetical protein Hypma_006666 [Hypsizygus marmoreus]
MPEYSPSQLPWDSVVMSSNGNGAVNSHKSSDQILQEIQLLLQEQNALLKRMDKRQAEADVSMQPVASVPARSSSAWNPLLNSTMRKTAPTLDRWRGGLDTLLIFVGLFSAIVTSFLVESLKTLEPDQGIRTNELLTNLTNIFIASSTFDLTSLQLSEPIPFQPSPSDVRVNVYWALALIISISVAALAVAGRAFLALLVRPEGDAVTKLTEIHHRWASTRRFLGPCLEGLPPVLMVPFTLFVVGLIDLLFSKSIGMPPQEMAPIAAASITSAIIVAIVAALLSAAVLHGIKHPRTSPFQSWLSRFLVSAQSAHFTTARLDVEASQGSNPDPRDEEGLSPSNRKVFHMALQETFDDEILDQSLAALDGVMSTRSISDRFYDQTAFPDLELRTILHLLSPEASLRSNLSAARMVRKICLGPDDLDESVRENLYAISHDGFSASQRVSLLTALVDAAKRHLTSRPHMVNGHTNEILMTAMASLIPVQGRIHHSHPVLTLLSANYLTRQPTHSLPSQLVDTYKAIMWYGISIFMRLLEVQMNIKLSMDHAKLDAAIVIVLGPCTLRPEYGKEILMSMMNSPAMTQNTSYQDSVNFDTMAECLVRWVAAGENALEIAMQVVDRALLEYFNPDPINYKPAHRSYPRAVHHILMLVYQSTQISSLQSLLFCTKFILKVEETFIWDVGRFMTLRVISRFLTLLKENSASLERKDWEACKRALTYVYTWTLYRAATFGEYDISLPEFQDTLPPREVFLSELWREWVIFHRGTEDTEVSSSPELAVLVPLPLPGWGLMEEEQGQDSPSMGSQTTM